jgi:hypothetical protein
MLFYMLARRESHTCVLFADVVPLAIDTLLNIVLSAFECWRCHDSQRHGGKESELDLH